MMNLLKKLCGAVVACSISVFTLYAQKPSYEGFGETGKYAAANARLPKKAAGEVRVVFFGNSITQNWADKYPEFFQTNGYIGRGISGQTSYQYLIRFRQDVIDLDPDIVVIGFGTNDIAENAGPYDEQRTMGNLKTMVELAQANGVRPILTSCLPAKSLFWNKNVTNSMKKIRHLNELIRAYAEEKGLDYVDYFEATVSSDGAGMRQDFTTDGVHPNAAGYRAMQKVVEPFLK